MFNLCFTFHFFLLLAQSERTEEKAQYLYKVNHLRGIVRSRPDFKTSFSLSSSSHGGCEGLENVYETMCNYYCLSCEL